MECNRFHYICAIHYHYSRYDAVNVVSHHFPPSILVLLYLLYTSLGFGYNIPSSKSSQLFTIFSMFFGILVVFSSIIEVTRIAFSFVSNKTNITHFHHSLILYLAMLLLTLLIGSLSFMFLEDISFVTALYLAVQTSTVRERVSF